jgi:hypothetical protein
MIITHQQVLRAIRAYQEYDEESVVSIKGMCAALESAFPDEPEFQPTSNPLVFLKGRELFQRKDDGTFEPFEYE